MKRNPNIVFFVILILILIFSAYRFYHSFSVGQLNGEIPAKSADTLIVITNPDPGKLWPYTIQLADDIFYINQIFQGLIRLNSQLIPVPDLARFWEISSDRRTYTFYLDSTRYFHNGQIVTAYDVAASFHYFFKHYSQSYNFPYFKKIEGVDAFLNGQADSVRGIVVVDSFTIQIRLRQPFSSFLPMLALPEMKILPASVLKDSMSTQHLPLIGSGRYRVKSFSDTALVLEAFPWNPEQQTPPYIKTIYFPLGNAQMQYVDSLNFDVNIFYYYPQDWAKDIFTILEQPSLGVFYLGFNCQRFPSNDINYRKAVAFALNRQAIVDSTYGTGQYLRHFTPFYYPHDGKFAEIPDYNPDSARFYLQRFIQVHGMVPPVVLMGDSTLVDTTLFQLIASDLRKMGIPVKILMYAGMSAEQEIDYLKTHAHLFLWGWSQDLPDPLFYFDVFLRSTQQMNLWQFKSLRVDALLDSAMYAMNTRKRNYYYTLLENIVARELPFLPVYSLRERIYLKKYIKGVELTPMGISQLDLSLIWKDPKMRRDYYVIIKQ